MSIKKITLTAMLLTIIPTVTLAEVDYDYTNPEHKADNTCVGVLSLVRDALFGDIDNIDTSMLIQRINPNSALAEFRNEMTDKQNGYILKYNSSSQFNNHYRATKVLVKNRYAARGMDYLTEELTKCL
jgi:hypothetical protein